MATHVARVGILSIANGQTDSPAITTLQFGRVGLRGAKAIVICSPETLPETITIEILPAGSSTWRTLQSGGVDVAVGADKAIVVSPLPFSDIRLHSGAGVAAQRDFDIDASMDMDY